MKTAGLPLLALVLTGSLTAEDAPAAASTKTSARLTQEIRATLPKFTPPPPPLLNQPKELTDADSDVLRLPKFTVREKRPPSHDPDLWLTDKAVQQKAMAAYKQSLTDVEWALNSWYIPVFGASPSARARAAYETNKSMTELRRMRRLFGVISGNDPKAAVELEKERIRMDQADEWQRRPAGEGRAK